MIYEWLTGTGSFDKLRQGHYDEGSACGFVKECDEVKGCISRVCAPSRDAYGGAFYSSCVLGCNDDRNMQTVDDFVCKNPETAYQLYGVRCEGYTPKGYISVFGREITLFQIATAMILFVIIYIVVKRI